MKATFLETRLDVLKSAQNPDGGWGYYPGKSSWLEPTVLAALALHGDPAADRAWNLAASWQQEDGAWRPAANVETANWSTSMAIVWAGVRGQTAEREQGQAWLRDQSEGGGWPWKKVGAAVEPTAWASLALPDYFENNTEFILQAEMSPDTCGPALMALQGSEHARKLIELAHLWTLETTSPMSSAWIALGMQLNGVEVPDPQDIPIPKNLQLVALQALAAPGGNYPLLKVSGARR